MKLEEILKANICAFGQTIFDMFSLEEDEFLKALEYYIDNNNFEEMLDEYAYEFEYDLDDIENISNNSNYKNKKWEYIDILNYCNKAFSNTIIKDKTISIEAFIDNIVNEFNKANK